MSDFVDPTDHLTVEQVLVGCLSALGPAAVLAQLSAVLPVRLGHAGGLFRAAVPTVVGEGEELLSIPSEGRPRLQHIVGGVVLSSDDVPPRELPGTLAALLMRALARSGQYDDAAVLLTALRDAVAAGR